MELINIRVDEETKEDLKMLALKEGISVSEFCRKIIYQRISVKSAEYFKDEFQPLLEKTVEERIKKQQKLFIETILKVVYENEVLNEKLDFVLCEILKDELFNEAEKRKLLRELTKEKMKEALLRGDD
jgi:antitoxin component of RelBE/YafQ-DinJ toxin-antitoxin module